MSPSFVCVTLALFLLNLNNADSSEDDILVVNSKTEALRVNVNFNVTNNKEYSSAPPNPDVTILSQNYFLCLWSYVVKDESNNKTTYSNEIYSNLFSTSSGKAMVRSEYLLNRIRGYSQDTPSATALFNTSNHVTRGVAVVWESQIEDPSDASQIIDAVFGRIIRWSITYSTGYRYVKVTSPTSKEFQISSPSIDYLHHYNPDVIPIYNTGMFLVCWISQSDNSTYNMVFIRIYYNSGRPYSEQIQVHDTDAFWKKHPRTIPLLHNLTLVSWLSQSVNSNNDNNLVVYGMIFDESGSSILMNTDEGRHPFLTMNDDWNHSIYHDTVPVMAHLHNDPYKNNNYFVLAWNAISYIDGSNTLLAAVYVYNDDSNDIERISDPTSLFDTAYNVTKYKIENPVMENIINELYELEMGLNAKIAVCYSLKDIDNDQTDIYCKILEIALWDDGESISANIYVVTDDTQVNPVSDSGSHHQHQHPAVSSESILRAQSDFSDTPQFVVVWSNSREGGYDVYTRILQVANAEDTESNEGNISDNEGMFGSRLNMIIFGVVLVLVVVVCVAVCICNKDHLMKPKRGKMQQLGEESDDDDDDRDAMIGGEHTTGRENDDGNDTDDGDGVQLYTTK